MKTEGYTDEEWAWIAASWGNRMGLNEHEKDRATATIRRLRGQRDAALAERDEARRVAKVLATRFYDSCSHGECCDARCIARRAALAYPEQPTEVKR